MKKTLCILSIIAFAAGAAFADFNGPVGYPSNQGFQGGMANYSVSPIKDVLNMYEDQITIVRGNIVSRISDDKYLFKDKTGEMVVEIDYKYWAGLQVNEKDVLELTGKVDRDYNSVTLDVIAVKKVK